MPGQKFHTVEDTAVPWYNSATEGLDLAPLEGDIIRVRGPRAGLREGTNQIDLCWLVSLFHIVFVGHYNNVCIPAIL